MDKNSSHIDDSFKDAFKDWEADFSASEMKADWSSVSSKIPNAPVSQPRSKPSWSAGKMLGLVSSAAIATTAAVIIYNTYIYSGEKMVPVQDSIRIEKNKQELPQADVQNIPQENNNTILLQAEKPAGDEAFSGDGIYENAGSDILNLHTGAKSPAKTTKEHTATQKNTGNDYILIPDTKRAQQENSSADSKENNGNALAPDKFVNTLNKKNFVFSDTIFCLGNAFSISYTAAQMPEAAIVEWGDGNQQVFGRINNHYYQKPGRYLVRIADGSRIIEKIIAVNELPKANFANYQCDEMQCKFRNNSKRALTYTWNFGDGSPEVTANHPEHQFRDTGKYTIVLKAYGTSNCVDSFIQQIRVTNYPRPIIGNVFTANGDGVNDKFTVVIENENYYHIRIMDAGGRTVFETSDKRQSWDGTINNQGNACPAGTYFYILSYRYDYDGPIKELKGYLNLIR